MLDQVKLSLRITTTAFDSQLERLIDAALLDLGIAGVDATLTDSPIMIEAVCIYCKLHFGECSNYDRLKAAYDEQKAQLRMSNDFSDNW